MSCRFLLFGTGLGANYGCNAIVTGTERILHRSFPDSDIWLPTWSCRNIDYEKMVGKSCRIVFKGSSLGNRSIHLGRRIGEKMGIFSRRLLPYPHRLEKKVDCVLSIGGDLYTFAEKEKNWPFPYPIMDAGNEVIGRCKPYVIWCASVGPLEKAGDRLNEMTDHLKACRAVIVREQESFSYLREIIGLKDNLYLAADPAFVMESEPFVFPFLERLGEEKLLAVNFSLGPMQHIHGNIPLETVQAKCLSLVTELLNVLGVKVLFIPHVHGDHRLLSSIKEVLCDQYPRRVAILPENLGAQKTKWAVSQANALLTMRFHCSIAGFSTNTPTMILVSTSKGAKICREMYGNLDYALNIKDMDTTAVISKVRRLLDNEQEIRKKLSPVCEEMKRRAFSAGDILAKIM